MRKYKDRGRAVETDRPKRREDILTERMIVEFTPSANVSVDLRSPGMDEYP